MERFAKKLTVFAKRSILGGETNSLKMLKIIQMSGFWEQFRINPFSANLRKWSYTLKQFIGGCRKIVVVCLTIL